MQGKPFAATFLQSLMSLGCGRKLEHLEETHRDARDTCKQNDKHNKHRIQPVGASCWQTIKHKEERDKTQDEEEDHDDWRRGSLHLE